MVIKNWILPSIYFFSTINTDFVDLTLKQRNLPDQEILKIIEEDLSKRQALNTADFTRSIYSEDCLFQDEISTYPLPEYIRGTKALFSPLESHTDLIGSVFIETDASNHRFVSASFKEKLAFNLPLIQPKVTLSGRLKLSLNNENLIVYSREYWNENVWKVLSTATF
jgi:hypothetical protein